MLLCRLVQSWMSLNADTDRPLAGWCNRHLKSCPVCQHADARTTQLTRHLARSSGRVRQAAPPFLAARVVNAVRADDSSRGRQPRLGLRRLAVGFSVAGLLALLTLMLGPWRTREAMHLASATNATTIAPPFQRGANLPFRLPDSASLMAYGARLDEPLEREWQYMVADAQAAARSLAANFIPDRPTGP